MMIPAEIYKENCEKLSLEELIMKRNELMASMNKYENRKILNLSDEILPEDLVKPSPKTVYDFHNQYLVEITKIIIEKLNNN